MSPENLARLQPCAPRFFCEGPEVDVGDGWYELLRTLAVGLEALPAPPIGRLFKAKHGALKVYCRDPYRRGLQSDATRLIDAAVEASLLTCETCGAPGRRGQDGGWIRVECAACNGKRQLAGYRVEVKTTAYAPLDGEVLRRDEAKAAELNAFINEYAVRFPDLTKRTLTP